MRIALAVVLLGMLVALTGCDILGLDFVVPSLHPFYTNEDVVFDPALLGSWERPRDEAREPPR